MVRAIWMAAGLAGVAAMTSGCGERPVAAAPTSYDVTGVILEVRATNNEALIRHDAIPGYMEAMTMPFDVKDPALLNGLKSGDVVRFKLLVEPRDSWAEGFQVLSNIGPQTVAARPAPVLNDPNGVSFYKDVPELKVGDLVPDYTLTNQLGQPIRLSQFRGKALAFNFFFTRCPLPDFCPREADNLSRVMRQLKSDPTMPANWHLLSISFEPENDPPKVLDAYGRRYRYDPEKWSFATGAHEEVQPLASHFGLYFARNVTPDNQSHNLRTIVLDPQGRVVEIIIGNRWEPAQVIEALKRALKPAN